MTRAAVVDDARVVLDAYVKAEKNLQNRTYLYSNNANDIIIIIIIVIRVRFLGFYVFYPRSVVWPIER